MTLLAIHLKNFSELCCKIFDYFLNFMTTLSFEFVVSVVHDPSVVLHNRNRATEAGR